MALLTRYFAIKITKYFLISDILSHILTQEKEVLVIFIQELNPPPIGFSEILLAKRQNSYYKTYSQHNKKVTNTKIPYP